MDQTRQVPGDYMSSNPEQQRVADTQGGQDALGSLEGGGSVESERDDLQGRKGGSLRPQADGDRTGSGSVTRSDQETAEGV